MKILKYFCIFCSAFILSCKTEKADLDEIKTIQIAIWPETKIEGRGERFPKQLIINETYFENIECEMVLDITTPKFSIWFGKTLAAVNFTNDSILFYQYDFEQKEPHSDLILHSRVGHNIKNAASNRYAIGWKHSMGSLLFYIKNGEQIFEKQFSKQDDQLMEMFWGAPYLGVSTGVINLIDSKIKIESIDKPKFAIYGDSFIEGSTMKHNLDRRWAYLFANRVGMRNCPINGKGGELFSQNFINRFINENSWVKSQYVILAFGANVYNLKTTKATCSKQSQSLFKTDKLLFYAHQHHHQTIKKIW